MKKIKSLLFAFICFTFVLMNVKAENLLNDEISEDNSNEILNKFQTVYGDSISLDNNVSGSALLLGATATNDKSVDGISFMLSAKNDFSGSSEYLFSASSTTVLSGNVEKDMLILAADVEVKDDFSLGRDGIILSSSVKLSGNIDRNLIIYASSVNLYNVNIKGNIKIIADTITIKDDVNISGVLKYNEDAKIEIADTAVIDNIEKLDASLTKNEVSFKEKAILFLYSLLRTIIVALALYIVFPKLFKKLEDDNKNIALSNVFSYLGKGALLLIFVPILMFLLLISSLGFSIGLMLIPIYIISSYISIIFSASMLGSVINKNVIKSNISYIWLVVIGIILIELLGLIPYVGSIIGLISVLIGMGMIFSLILKARK